MIDLQCSTTDGPCRACCAMQPPKSETNSATGVSISEAETQQLYVLGYRARNTPFLFDEDTI